MLRIIPLIGLLLGSASSAAAFELSFPLACKLGSDCWIQQYVDHDASASAQDFTCGSASYDGHDGTDIRVRDTSLTSNVLAAAPGTVKAIRDGEPDRLVRSPEEEKRVRDKECGNGVAVAHEGGYETQYCHMKRGSIKVMPGDSVAAGKVLGEIGYSGAAGFPHLHLTLRKDGKAIDPFSVTASTDCSAVDTQIWSPPITYVGETVLRAGFHDGPLELDALERGTLPDAPITSSSPALVAYVWLINLRGGDGVRIDIAGPNGFTAGNANVLDRNKAQYFLFAGRKRPSDGFAPGQYTARFTVTRGAEVVLEKSVSAELR